MVGLGIPNEVRSAKGTIMALAFVPHRRVRHDLFYIDDPVEHVCRTIGGIADQALWRVPKRCSTRSIMVLVDSTSCLRFAVVDSTSMMIPCRGSAR